MSKFTRAEKDEILAIHNNLRSSVALGNCVSKGVKLPSASNMLKMIWDDKLASAAQAVADKCVFAHSETPDVGENIFSTTGKELPGVGKRASESWANELQKNALTGTKMTESVFGKFGHASQMIWANSERIGCGRCDGTKSNLMVFCMYGPPGNYLDRNIYEVGPAGSKAPAGYALEKKTGLCVKK